MQSSPRVFSIASGVNFLDTLADALIDGALFDMPQAAGFELADTTIYLPTRRAVRALEVTLAEKIGGEAILLPKITPLGETDEAEFDLVADLPESESALVLAPAVSSLERRLVFARLIQQWARTVDQSLLGSDSEIPFRMPDSSAEALALAGDLEALMDGFTIENIPWDAIQQAVETDYSEYFRLTLDFVRIAREAWPAFLRERGAADPVERRNAMILAEARRLREKKPAAPVVAAGSTGSLPATAELLAAVSRLPNGAVVLPGLDFDLDDVGFNALGGDTQPMDSVHGHPQALLHRLLTHFIGISRHDVRPLGSGTETVQARNRMISEALRPAETTDRWARIEPQERRRLAETACRDLTLIEAADEREEALAVAVALRDALQTPDRTAMLVTPDRGLAERVKAELRRWNIEAEDTAGTSLADSPAGVFARLIADAAAARFDAFTMSALLHHPLLSCGLSRDDVVRAVRTVDLAVLHGPECAPGIGGLREALTRRRETISEWEPLPVRRIEQDDWDLAARLLDYLENAFTSFSVGELPGTMNLLALSAEHRRVFELLTAPAESEADSEPESSSETLISLFDSLDLVNGATLMGRGVDYPPLFLQLARQVKLYLPGAYGHRRVKIMGLLEARLLTADCVVLGGLDEGIWPPFVKTDAFLNRPMRAAVGLSPPERRIGQTAHDFSQLIGGKRVVLSRAGKRDGSPTIPSRFLQRIRAFVGDEVWSELARRGHTFQEWAKHIDFREETPTVARPEPQSRPETFPRALTVTEIETLMRDPYSIFARHVLKLEPLPPLAEPPGASDRGTMVHAVLNRFVNRYPHRVPDDAADILRRFGEHELRGMIGPYPHLYAEWLGRFMRIVEDYVAWERKRREDARVIFTERRGSWVFPLPDGGVFMLRGRADRIELKWDGTFAIIDFKTGRVPGVKEVVRGFSPQLTLEAMMLMEAGFEDCPQADSVPELLYVQASGSRTRFKARDILAVTRTQRQAPEVIVAHHREILVGTILAFSSGNARYVSQPNPRFPPLHSAYTHLARVAEWRLSATEDEE